MNSKTPTEINKDILLPFLIYDKPFPYYGTITLYPVTMDNILLFQTLSQSIIIRKDSIFHNKKIIKMSYLDFLIYAFGNKELETQYKIPYLSQYYLYAIQLLQLCCKDAEITMDQTGYLYINKILITPEIFDDLRRIIILQNEIDFDIDEFLNYDTEQRLQKADTQNHKKDKITIEDYIDSLIIAMNTTENQIINMTIRKFWRYIKRYQLHENYTIAKTSEYSGLVSFKEPIPYWMVSLDEEDKYKHLKTDENELKGKIH
ncbi:MAG: hypothetical protein HFG39_05935 [Lachnospiraceae bacterium]|nr:hypothetical protein [Lachnospiraceae bacterium]